MPISGSGRPRTTSSLQNIAKVVSLALSPPGKPHSHLSTRKIARKTQIPRSSVQRLIKEAGLKVYKRVPAQKLGKKVKENRLKRCKILLKKLRENLNYINQVIFSDEKDFLITSVPVNTQNSRVYSIETKKTQVPAENLILERSRFSEK